MTPALAKRFQRMIYDYYQAHGRVFSWRETDDPYRILVSEVMLQQTQTSRVAVKYEEFVTKFPDFTILSRASLSDILSVWQGLGYNRRAMNLQKTAIIVLEKHGGVLPSNEAELVKLPGIGSNTAGAIATFAFNQPAVFIETNIRAVYHYFFFPDFPSVPDSSLHPLIAVSVDSSNPRQWYYALYDYGIMLKRERKATDKPKNRQSIFEGSDRQLRGAILRSLLQHSGISESELAAHLNENLPRLHRILEQLETEGFILRIQESVRLQT